MIISLCNSNRPNATTEVTLYTAPTNSRGVPITKFVAVNESGIAAAFTAKIVGAGGGTLNQIPYQVVNRRPHVSPVLPGCVIPPGGSLRVTVTAANSIAFTVAGDA